MLVHIVHVVHTFRTKHFTQDTSLLYYYSIAMLRMSGALAKSTDVMKAMGSLIRIPEIQATMRELSKEMTKVIT